MRTLSRLLCQRNCVNQTVDWFAFGATGHEKQLKMPWSDLFTFLAFSESRFVKGVIKNCCSFGAPSIYKFPATPLNVEWTGNWSRKTLKNTLERPVHQPRLYAPYRVYLVSEIVEIKRKQGRSKVGRTVKSPPPPPLESKYRKKCI